MSVEGFSPAQKKFSNADSILEMAQKETAVIRSRGSDTQQGARKLTLFCVNRSFNTDFSAGIRLQQFAAARSVSIHLPTSESISDADDEVNPTHSRAE